MIALMLPVLFVAFGYLYSRSVDTSGFKGFGVGLLLILGFFCVTVPLSLLFAIAALFRGERFLLLTAIECVAYFVLTCLTIQEIAK